MSNPRRIYCKMCFDSVESCPKIFKNLFFQSFFSFYFLFFLSIFVFLRKIYAQVKSFAQHNHVARSTIFPFLIDDWWQLHALGMVPPLMIGIISAMHFYADFCHVSFHVSDHKGWRKDNKFIPKKKKKLVVSSKNKKQSIIVYYIK